MTTTKERIKRAWQYGPWNRLDIEVYHFNYRLHDIADWPFDAVEVLRQDSEVVFLGSLKAACSLEKWPEYFGENVNIVLSMCLDDMAVKGAPKDWSTYFRCHGVHHSPSSGRHLLPTSCGCCGLFLTSRSDASSLHFRLSTIATEKTNTLAERKQRAHVHALRWRHQQKCCRDLCLAHLAHTMSAEEAIT